jgi:hypothetical protein
MKEERPKIDKEASDQAFYQFFRGIHLVFYRAKRETSIFFFQKTPV